MLPEGSEQIGKMIDWPAGIELFVRMACGGVATGIFFGLMFLFVLRMFARNLDCHENVVEVMATITTACLCQCTAEVAWGCSGVIATVTLGLMAAAGG